MNRRYFWFVIPAVGVIAVLLFAMTSLNDLSVFYYEPTEVADGVVDDPDERFRLGGLVEAGTVETTEAGVRFLVTDGKDSIAVVHRGAPEGLFQEGIGVVVEGTWDGAAFHSDTMMVRHDEQYRSDDGIYQTPEQGVSSP